MASWVRTIYSEFELLAGKSAPHDFLQLVIYKAATFSEEIQALDTVRAYHVRLHPLPVLLILMRKIILERTQLLCRS